MTFPIDKGLPAPEPRRRNNKYPWAEMKPGDSFLVGATDENKRRVQINLIQSAKAAKINTGREFTTATVPEGIRIWRVK